MAEVEYKLAGDFCETKLKGHLDDGLADWFEDLTFSHEIDGTTIITGDNIDQTTLHGLPRRIRLPGLGMQSMALDYRTWLN